MNLWYLVPIDETALTTKMANLLSAALTDYLIDTDYLTTGDTPGFYVASSVDAYTTAYNAASSLDTSTATADAMRTAIDNLKAAYDALETVPITEGYYYIVSAGKGSGYNTSDSVTVNYDDEDEFALYNDGGYVKWNAYDTTNPSESQIYYFSDAGDGNWYVKNLTDGTYISCGEGFTGENLNSVNITTSTTATYSQVFTQSYVGGKWTATFNGNGCVYSLTSSHNGAGSNTSGNLRIWGYSYEANRYKVNLWYLVPADEDKVIVQKNELAVALEECVLSIDESEISDAIGFYSQDRIDAYNAAYTAASNLDTSTATAEEISSAVNKLIEAYTAASQVTSITEGYYYIVSAGKGAGNNSGDYDDVDKYALYNSGSYVYWKAWDKTALNQMYYFTPDNSEGNWYVKNLCTETYIKYGYNGGTYNCNVATSADPEYTQVFEETDVMGKWTIKYYGNSNVYSLTNSHNGQKGSKGTSTSTTGNLKIWGSHAEANNYGMNVWYIYPVDFENMKTAVCVYITEFNTDYTVGEGLGEYTWSGGTSEQWTEKMDGFQSIVTSETSTVSDVETVCGELCDMINNISLNMPEDGTFMRIHGSTGTSLKYMQVADYSTSAKRVAVTTDGTTKESIYCYYNGKLLNYSTGYYLYCYSTGSSIGYLRTTSDLASSLADGVDITISASSVTDGCYTIDYVNSYGTTRRLSISSSGTSVTSVAATSTSTNSAIVLEEVTTLPVTLNGSNPYYATINLPVAVTLPDGLAAYSVSEGDGVLYLTALNATTLPANTPVLLYSETGTDFDLTIVDDASSATSTGFDGTVAAATVTSGASYVLGSVNSVVGFYKYTGTEMPGFKAYYTGSAASNGFSLVFGGDADDLTAVDGIDAEGGDADAPYYDLQGRKVTSPMKGQIYIHAGKKVRY